MVRTYAVIAMTLSLLALPPSYGLAQSDPSSDQRKLVVEGAQLWPIYCAQCHNARPGSQFSPTQWDAITMHMRTQSSMPAKDMRAIKEFLKTAR